MFVGRTYILGHKFIVIVHDVKFSMVDKMNMLSLSLTLSYGTFSSGPEAIFHVFSSVPKCRSVEKCMSFSY